MISPVRNAARRLLLDTGRPGAKVSCRVLFLLITTGLAGCGGESGPGTGSLADIKASGLLVVQTRNAPTTYYLGAQRVQGIEHDLVSDFADHLGVEVRFEVTDSVREVVEAVASGDAHLGAAGVTRTKQRREQLLFGPGYQTVEQQVVCRRGGASPSGVDDLAGLGLTVAAGTSYAERLEALAQDYPEIEFEASTSLGTEALLRQVWRRQLDCTVADSNLVAINRRYYPELEIAFTLGSPDTLAWIMPKGAHRLNAQVQKWFRKYEDSGALDQAMERYYGFVQAFDYVDARRFQKRVNERLPRFRPLFESAAKRHGFPWRLIAAQSYQESHWNPRARSPTGVRGMMMLTRNTAGSLGVTDRLDPAQSINGGARYLRRLHDRLDEEVSEPDRTWLALAAYNIGFAHLTDARQLTGERGGDPRRWADVAETLPSLADPKVYKKLRHGYARGTEPVRYVRNIRNYRDMLERFTGIKRAAVTDR